ncbi:eCIS core domain-containing protein [Paractinoplanes rishiriensis]|uniref:eCIS core domain-containing protein n=1 Tax=Paractinoplanes rishiriensis TaxID=1050105 RepID=UPI001940B52E|nr:DUF4157 domain-containing protein [Actinoplanes rishiriensis]
MPGREVAPAATHQETPAADTCTGPPAARHSGGNRELAATVTEPAAPAATPPVMRAMAAGGNRALAAFFERPAAPEGFRQAVESSGSGQELPDGLRAEAETAFGADFSDVRVHRSDAAAHAAHQAGARAFTLGPDIYLGAGQSTGDRQLMAHELTHVRQGGGPAASSWVSDPADPAEREAEAVATRFTDRRELPPITGGGSTPVVLRTPEGHKTPAELIDSFTSWGNLDEDALGRRLFDLAWMSASHYGFVGQVLDALDDGDRDDVTSMFVRSARDDNLDQFAQSDGGRAMLKRMIRELAGGFTAVHEGAEAVRLNNAVRRAEGAAEGGVRAGEQLATAENEARNAPVKAEQVPALPAAELADRARLLEAVLDKILAEHPKDDAVGQAVAAVRGRLAAVRAQAATDPAAASAPIVVGQRIVERCQRDLALLDAQLAHYAGGSADQASAPAYTAATTRVRTRYVEALTAALTPGAEGAFAVAQASAAALPKALTEVDLGIMSKRQGGYELLNPRVAQMTEWATWIRGRLAQLDVQARELAAAREAGAADVTDREKRFAAAVEMIQLSMEGVNHWDRAVHGYEALAGNFNVVLSGYEDVVALMKRLAGLRDLALGNDLDGLRAGLSQYRADPAVEKFYTSIPDLIRTSSLITGFAILLIATVATAGVGALVAAGEGATMLAVAGSVALETVTFTTVQRGLSGMIAPQTTPLLLDLIMNAGLFGLLRGVGEGVRTAMAARGFGTMAIGAAQHAAAFPILQAWGTVHFRIEEGRWPTADEFGVMALESLVMYAALSVTARSVSNMIGSRRQLAALERFHAKYGTDLAQIEAGRAKLAEQMRTALASGKAEDPAVIEPLRKQAAELDAKLRTIVESVRGDTAIGADALRKAMGDLAQEQAAISGELLTRSFELPERVGLQRGGGLSQYTYEAGTTQVLVDRMKALGASVTETVDASGRRVVTAQVQAQPPMFFAERSTPADLQPRLVKLAGLIDKPGSTNAERAEVINQLRTPTGKERGELEGFALDTVVAENQKAVADLVTQLTAQKPDVIVGMVRGGAFLTDVLKAASPDLAGRVRTMQVHRNPDPKQKGGKFEDTAMQAEFQALIDGGAKNIAVVDYYMGGTTGRSLRDQIFKPLAEKNPGVTFETHWIRERLGFEQLDPAGGITMQPRSGQMKKGAPNADRITSDEQAVRMALGDDMEVAFNPASTEPITIFDKTGRIVRVIYPKPGQTTRDVLIELLSQKPAGP